MRNGIYDYNGWSRESGMVPQDWLPGELPEPYGEVPGALPPEKGEEPRLRRFPGMRRERRTRRSPACPREGNGTSGFCLALALLLILAGVAVYFQGGVRPRSPLIEQFWDPSYGWDGYYGYTEDFNWAEELENTAIPRAPLEPGVTLALLSNEGESLTPQEIYDRVNPAVVGIRAETDRGVSLGTGVVMTENGYIITNAHVISGARAATVIFPSNIRAEALLVGYDGETDLAVLKTDRQDLIPAVFGDSALLRVGDPAYAIGNPLGEELRGTMTDGIISAIDRTVDMDGQSMTLIQTSAALNSGNSGGALINAAGQVVGITNMKMMSRGETIEGLGFAVPSTLAKAVADQIIATGSYAGRPGLGVTVIDHFDAEGNPDGAEIVIVKKDSDGSGRLFAGDVIVGAQGEPVTCIEDLLRIKERYSVGDSLVLRIRTGSEIQELSVRLLRSSELARSPDLFNRRDGS